MQFRHSNLYLDFHERKLKIRHSISKEKNNTCISVSFLNLRIHNSRIASSVIWLAIVFCFGDLFAPFPVFDGAIFINKQYM